MNCTWSLKKLLLKRLIYECEDWKTYFHLSQVCKYTAKLCKKYIAMKMSEFSKLNSMTLHFTGDKIIIFNFLPNGIPHGPQIFRRNDLDLVYYFNKGIISIISQYSPWYGQHIYFHGYTFNGLKKFNNTIYFNVDKTMGEFNGLPFRMKQHQFSCLTKNENTLQLVTYKCACGSCHVFILRIISKDIQHRNNRALVYGRKCRDKIQNMKYCVISDPFNENIMKRYLSLRTKVWLFSKT